MADELLLGALQQPLEGEGEAPSLPAGSTPAGPSGCGGAPSSVASSALSTSIMLSIADAAGGGANSNPAHGARHRSELSEGAKGVGWLWLSTCTGEHRVFASAHEQVGAVQHDARGAMAVRPLAPRAWTARLSRAGLVMGLLLGPADCY